MFDWIGEIWVAMWYPECWVEARKIRRSRVERVRELKRYYSAVLAEDRMEGTPFDCAVLDSLDDLEKRFKT